MDSKHFIAGGRNWSYEYHAGFRNGKNQGNRIKKALGARKRRILGQFLTEASVLTSIGGIIGVGAGIGLAQIVSKFAEVPVAISGVSIVISVVFSMAVGIVSVLFHL